MYLYCDPVQTDGISQCLYFFSLTTTETCRFPNTFFIANTGIFSLQIANALYPFTADFAHTYLFQSP